MSLLKNQENLSELVENLNFKQKVERSLSLIKEAYKKYKDRLVVAHSLGKDSACVWDLAKKVNSNIKGFVIATRFHPKESVEFMKKLVSKYPEIEVFKNDQEIPDKLYNSNPDKCCHLLKVLPTRWAIEKLGVKCWITGLRCTEGLTRTDFKEVEERDEGLIKLNPILTWKEREVWQYLALNNVEVNPAYKEGYRSLGCEPCTEVSSRDTERAGRWAGTNKCGGECGIHTRPLKVKKEGE